MQNNWTKQCQRLVRPRLHFILLPQLGLLELDLVQVYGVPDQTRRERPGLLSCASGFNLQGTRAGIRRNILCEPARLIELF
jgi:hypothetical protein